MRRQRKSCVRRLAVTTMPFLADIPGRSLPHQRRAGSRGIRDGDGRRQLLDVESHEIGGVARLRLGLGDDQYDRLTHMANHALRQPRTRCVQRAGRLDLRRLVARPASHDVSDTSLGEVRAGIDGSHTGRAPRRLNVDETDISVRDRRAHEGCVGLPVPVYVIGEPACSGQEPDVFAPANRLRDPVIGVHMSPLSARLPEGARARFELTRH